MLNRFRTWFQIRMCCQIPRRYWGHPEYFPHPLGVGIGNGVKLGRDVRIYQHVSIGRLRPNQGTGEKDYPIIEDEVVIYSGAVVAGAVTVGRGAVVGANAVITKNVPAGAMAFGYNQIRTILNGEGSPH